MHDEQSSSVPAESEIPIGTSNHNHLLAWMQKNNVPITPENYLELSFPDGVPDPLPEEVEEELAEVFGEAS